MLEQILHQNMFHLSHGLNYLANLSQFKPQVQFLFTGVCDVIIWCYFCNWALC